MKSAGGFQISAGSEKAIILPGAAGVSAECVRSDQTLSSGKRWTFRKPRGRKRRRERLVNKEKELDRILAELRR